MLSYAHRLVNTDGAIVLSVPITGLENHSNYQEKKKRIILRTYQ